MAAREWFAWFPPRLARVQRALPRPATQQVESNEGTCSTHNHKTPHHATQALEAQLEVVEGRVDLANLGVDHRLALVVQMLVQSLLQTCYALDLSNLLHSRSTSLEANGLIVRGTVVAEVEPHVEVGRGCNNSISTLVRQTKKYS